MSTPNDAPDPGPAPIAPRRAAAASQAVMAIALVFFFGLVIGFILAKTL